MSDMSSGMATASALSPSESQTDTLITPQSSMTCVSSHSPVQPNNTEELRTWLAQAFPASPSVLQESKPEPTTRGICGPPRQTLFASYSLNPFCLKTCQDLFPADTLEPSSLTWPRWGMWGGGELSELDIPALPIDVTGSGSWLTPSANEDAAGSLKGNMQNMLTHQVKRADLEGAANGGQLSADWVDWLMGWPVGWSGLERLETVKFQTWLAAHGSCSHEAQP